MVRACPSGRASVTSAQFVAATPASVPAVPDHCRVLGRIDRRLVASGRAEMQLTLPEAETQAAKDAGKLAIGVDSNQNHLHPGTMLTSMVKRVDVAVFNAAKKVNPGLTVLGLKEGGVDYAMDANNAALVPAAMKAKVDAAKADIIAGKIKVVDFMVDNACK